MVAFAVAAAIAQRSIARIDRSWDAYRAEIEFGRGGQARARAARVGRESRRRRARGRWTRPPTPTDAFDALGALVERWRGRARGRVVSERSAVRLGWNRRALNPDTLEARLGAVFTPFYLTLYATAYSRRCACGGHRARFTRTRQPIVSRKPLDAAVARASGVRGYEYQPAAEAPSGFTMFASRTDTLFGARPSPITPSEARLRAVEQATRRGAVLLAVALAFLLIGAWARPSSFAQRLLAVATALAAVALVPLNPTFSSVTRLFDPVVYLAPLGGPLTASVGALMLTSGLVLLGVARGAALAGTASVAVAGAARGARDRRVRPVPASRSRARDQPAAVGRDVRRCGSRGRSRCSSRALRSCWPVYRPVRRCSARGAGSRRSLPRRSPRVAAVIAPLLWEPTRTDGPIGIPRSGFWRSGHSRSRGAARGFVLTAAVVAACGAATLVWGTVAKNRVELAERDVAGLSTPDPTAQDLLGRMARELEQGSPPSTRADLLDRYVRSDLDDAGLLGRAHDVVVDRGRRAPTPTRRWCCRSSSRSWSEVASVVAEARRTGAPVMRAGRGTSGAHLVLAVPHGYGRITSVTVPPRTRLIPRRSVQRAHRPRPAGDGGAAVFADVRA